MSMTKTRGSKNQKLSLPSSKVDLRDAVSCAISFEKCQGGFRICCNCDDTAACEDFQSLCEAICDGECICCCVRDEKPICTINLCCSQCKCENTADGCCITCTNAKCCAMLQACCDCLEACCQDGCCCYICFDDKCCCFGGCCD